MEATVILVQDPHLVVEEEVLIILEEEGVGMEMCNVAVDCQQNRE